jgi:hemoglobin
MQFRMTLISVLAVAVMAACGGKAKSDTGGGGGDSGATLYDRLGKKDAITAVVKDFVEERVAKDERIKSFFLNTDIPNLEAKLVEQICQAAKGPCTYTGKDMKTVHASLKIKDADFNALVEDLKASLDHFKVGDQEQKELIGALATMHDDIVTAK